MCAFNRLLRISLVLPDQYRALRVHREFVLALCWLGVLNSTSVGVLCPSVYLPPAMQLGSQVTVRYGMVWYGMAWYGMVWSGSITVRVSLWVPVEGI